ncbi:hypothetical protein GRI97_13665 [Altererythrobacter xixiisoli]|uniref:SPOR domain-containing protein n=1 Tax=Croceibacterium xixiisoli TaxID=1476466 RepID=A0A6I4TVD3_9SPHN|nr:SPOR domain-containing protein [Croceibacterium xixiisoli]MXP00037.1 hypothetical protein [Croceibacterium xixiisoli]
MKLHVDDSRRLNAGVSAFALAVPLAAVLLLSAIAPARAREAEGRPVPAANGPQADYPMVVGPPYTVGSTTYTPEDRLNYDEVGYVTADAEGGDGISGSHHTLPLPSYVEVTSLATGRTILVRMERRGPMASDHLVALSAGALSQLGATPGTPVRVRRVVPPEEQRAVLRAGQSVPPRMDTPMSLVEVLKRKLPARGSAPLQALVQDGADETRPATRPPVGLPAAARPPAASSTVSAPSAPPVASVRPVQTPAALARADVAPSTVAPPAAAPTPAPAPSPAPAAAPSLPPLAVQSDPAPRPTPPPARAPAPSSTPTPAPARAADDFDKAFAPVAAAPAARPPVAAAPAPTPAPARTPAPAPAPPSRPAAQAGDGFVVQAAAFSSSTRAERVARVIGGTVVQSGNVFRVRTGPFPTRAAAEASLAKVQAAGYREARIFTNS